MTRSFALAFAAVTLRIYLPLSLVGGIEYADARQRTTGFSRARSRDGANNWAYARPDAA
jgi:hypothetical protein